MNRHFAIFILACTTTMYISGCTNNILVSKNGERYFLATKQNGLKKMLCDSGDMTAILQGSQLGKPLEDQLYANICAAAINKEKTLELLGSMTKEERERLKFSFQQHGYDVNYVFC